MPFRLNRFALYAAVAAASVGLSAAAHAAEPIKIGVGRAFNRGTFSLGGGIKIGVAGSFTGGSSSMGVSMRDGVRLAIDEINKAGGVLGRPLQAIERDDEAKNERG